MHCRCRTICSGTLLLVIAAPCLPLPHAGHFIGTMEAFASNQMDFGSWMAIKLSPEQSFELETQCRNLQKGGDVGKLAASLLRQTVYQRELLQSAVNEIARLELKLMS
jgi:hypothetical protein